MSSINTLDQLHLFNTSYTFLYKLITIFYTNQTPKSSLSAVSLFLDLGQQKTVENSKYCECSSLYKCSLLYSYNREVSRNQEESLRIRTPTVSVFTAIDHYSFSVFFHLTCPSQPNCRANTFFTVHPRFLLLISR